MFSVKTSAPNLTCTVSFCGNLAIYNVFISSYRTGGQGQWGPVGFPLKLCCGFCALCLQRGPSTRTTPTCAATGRGQPPLTPIFNMQNEMARTLWLPNGAHHKSAPGLCQQRPQVYSRGTLGRAVNPVPC